MDGNHARQFPQTTPPTRWIYQTIFPIRLYPHFPSAKATTETDTISWVTAHHDSPHGEIAVGWSREADDSLFYSAIIPPNTTAELTLPKTSPWGGKDQTLVTRTLLPGNHQFVIGEDVSQS